MNEVLRVLAARARADSKPGAREDGLRVALAIEGGGMRGTVSAGMALALDELDLVPAFDAVYGASAGAITGAWLLSRPEGLRGWTEPAYARTLIRRSEPHVLVLRSRRDPLSRPDGHAPSRSARSARLIARTTLRRESPALSLSRT